MSENGIVLHQARQVEQFNGEQMALIKSMICVGASDDELKLFVQVCHRTGLDPFTRQIYAIVRHDNGKPKLTIQTSIDGFRLIADRTGQYAGQIGPEWCGDDGIWRDVWLDSKPPKAARVGVLRKDWTQPLYAVARWDTYCQTNNKGEPGYMWKKMPDLMIAKVAESIALRRAFPADLSGLYTTEEMAQADERIVRDERPVRTVNQVTGEIIETPAKKQRKPETLLDWRTYFHSLTKKAGWTESEATKALSELVDSSLPDPDQIALITDMARAVKDGALMPPGRVPEADDAKVEEAWNGTE